MTGHPKLHNEIVDKLLRRLLGKDSLFNISFYINIEEGRNAAKAHCGAVLLLDCGKVGKIGPLNSLLGILCGLAYIEAVHCGHFL